MFPTRIFTVLIALYYLAMPHSMGTEIVRNGKALACIMIAPKATRSAQMAAFELQYHLEKISGAKVPIQTDPATAPEVRILIGESAATREKGIQSSDFSSQEYLVQVEDKLVILLGKDQEDFSRVDYQRPETFPDGFTEIGTCYAVYDFLEKLGVRWYLPTGLGTAYTPATNVSAPEMRIRRSPAMKYRELSLTLYTHDLVADTINSGREYQVLARRETDLFKLRQRLGGDPIKINHSFYKYYDRFLADKPGWFAQGYDGKPPQLCYSNPEVLQQVIQDARDYFDGKVRMSDVCSNIGQYFNSNVFPVFPMDNRSWCKCHACQAQLKRASKLAPGQFSSDQSANYIFGFVNQVAKALQQSHPGKMVGTAAYMDYSYPPDKVSLADNVMISLCFHTRMVYANHIQKNEQAILAAWKNAYPELPKMAWMWYCFPTLTAKYQQFRCFPGFFAHHVNAIMRRFLSAGVTGLFIEPSYMDFPTVHGILMDQLELYLTLKLADDPTLDANAMIHEFFTLFYGSAAKPMQQFYELVENTFCDPANYPPDTKHQNEEIAWTRLGTEERMQQLAGFMAESRKLAVQEPFNHRVEIFDQGVWQFMLKGQKDYQDREAMLAPTMQQTAAPKISNPDPGNPLTLNWEQAARISLRYTMKAEITSAQLEARLAHDGVFFYLRYEHQNVDTEKLETKNLVWLNDEWESFFAKQRGKPYHQLAVDAGEKWGAMQYEGTVDQRWDFPGKIVSQMNPQKRLWQVFIAIPLKDLVLHGISPGEILYFNVIRSEKAQYLGSWIPTFGGYKVPGRFGEVYLEK